MARPLKYRFDLLKPGEAILYPDAKFGDVNRRLKGYVKRLDSRPVPDGEARTDFFIHPFDGGVRVVRLDAPTPEPWVDKHFVTRLPDPMLFSSRRNTR